MYCLWVTIAAFGLFALFGYLIRRGRKIEAHCNRLSALLDAAQRDIDASPLCCASIVHLLGPKAQCHCFLCRRTRGESTTEESQN
jgi:hypothetical protein